MRAVGLKVLKNKLSEYVRLVAGGETVLITDRDRVVAELVPAEGRGRTVDDVALAELVRQGLLTPQFNARVNASARRSGNSRRACTPRWSDRTAGSRARTTPR